MSNTSRGIKSWMNHKGISGVRIITYLMLGAGAIVMMVPFFWMIWNSFRPHAEITHIPPFWIPKVFDFSNYISVITDTQIGRHYINSLFVASTITVSAVFFSALVGYVFAKFKFRFQGILFLFVLASMMVPFHMRIIPLYILMIKLGWIDTYAALIVPGMFNAFCIFLMRQYVHSIPSELMDAGRIDGCSELSIFARIILPLVKPAIAALTIFVFMWSWDDFLWPLIVLNKSSLFTLPIALNRLKGSEYFVDYGPLLAAICLVVLPVLIVFLFFQKRFIQGITLTGLKM